MGKIVKYCSSCDEGFAEKFGFCPNCAAPLQAFEMNPLGGVDKATDPIVEVPPVAAADTQANLADTILEMPEPVEPPSFIRESKAPEIVESEPIEVANADVIEDEPVQPAPPATETVWATTPSVPVTETYSGAGFHNYEPTYTKEDDGGYYVTVIQEKNVAQRNVLLLGALALMLTLSVGSYFASLFQKEIGVGAIGDDRSIAMLLEDVPMPILEEEKKKADEDSGGGGGGGKNDPREVNQGDLPDQTKNPLRPPDPNVHRSDNFELKMPPPSTEGNVKTPKNYDRWGDPSRFGNIPSSGPGSGGGMGTGIGTGAGSGRGTGMGSGNGSGSGSGDGDGNGDGSGSGSSRAGNPPPPPVGVTSPLRILANPRATYTEAARTNNVQGSVLVKVTLLASGQVGSVTVVRGLPHGLSEKAIAAAKLIRFEPKKVNGVPVTSVKTMEYTFSIY